MSTSIWKYFVEWEQIAHEQGAQSKYPKAISFVLYEQLWVKKSIK